MAGLFTPWTTYSSLTHLITCLERATRRGPSQELPSTSAWQYFFGWYRMSIPCTYRGLEKKRKKKKKIHRLKLLIQSPSFIWSYKGNLGLSRILLTNTLFAIRYKSFRLPRSTSSRVKVPTPLVATCLSAGKMGALIPPNQARDAI